MADIFIMSVYIRVQGIRNHFRAFFCKFFKYQIQSNQNFI